MISHITLTAKFPPSLNIFVRIEFVESMNLSSIKSLKET